MSLHVHLNRASKKEDIEMLKTLLSKDVLLTVGEDPQREANYDVLVHDAPSVEWIENHPNLRAIIIPWAGVNKETIQLLRQYPRISLHNLHHNNFNTAELGFALLLAASKNLVPMDQALRKNDWSTRFSMRKAILLREKTALILGFGEIGRALASYCLGLGMQVKAIRKHIEVETDDLSVDVYSADRLHQLLPKADVIFIALPLTEETKDLIGEKELMLLPKDSILINIGRGPVVNQFALYNALKSGHLAAAGSDVWYNYPNSRAAHFDTPPADVPFGELENFVLSPHRGGMVEDVEMQWAHALADLLNAANQNLPIPNRVDLEAGY